MTLFTRDGAEDCAGRSRVRIGELSMIQRVEILEPELGSEALLDSIILKYSSHESAARVWCSFTMRDHK